MGSDGGSINKSKSIVLTSSVKGTENMQELVSLGHSVSFQVCRLSEKPLEQPVMVDHYGYLYNKIAILEHLIAKKSNSHSATDRIPHIKRLKDLIELQNVKIEKKNGVSVMQCASTGDILTHGKQFLVFVRCGCLVPMSALVNSKALDSTNFAIVDNTDTALWDSKQIECHSCGNPDNNKHDILIVNPYKDQDKRYNVFRQKYVSQTLKQNIQGKSLKSAKKPRQRTERITK